METLPTLLDLMKIEAGIGYNIVAECLKRRNELSLVPAATINGRTIPLTVLKTLPTSSFRNYNEGVSRSIGKWENRIYQAAILDKQVAVDRSMADDAMDRGRFLEQQTFPSMESALNHACLQFWYGIGNDEKGFVGLNGQIETGATHVVNATGSAAKTSVYFLEIGTEKVEWIYGNGRTITMDPGWKEETIYDDDGKAFPGLTNWIRGSIGVRVANKNAVVQIKNIGTATGKTLTDALMFSAQALMTEINMLPTHIFMTGRSREQLRVSRTATNATGAPAPLPRDWEGIPIIPTPFISNAEA